MDELLDIVNDQDMIIDQQMRSSVHQLGLQHRGVHVFLFTKDGRLLVQKRSTDRVAAPSLLDCSVSEHVKSGESYLDAAIRGVREELGLGEIEIKPLVKFKMNYGLNDNEISVLYKGIVEPENVKFDPVEIEQVGYYEISELQKMPPEKFCGWFIEILNCYLNKPAKMQILARFDQRR